MSIICVEGPPGVGKSTVSLELQDRYGAYVVPQASIEQEKSSSKQCADQKRRWNQALEKAEEYALVVLDGDIFMPLVYAAALKDRARLEQLLDHFQAVFSEHTIVLPDYYVYLYTSAAALKKRQNKKVKKWSDISAAAHRHYYNRFLEGTPAGLREIRAGHEETAARDIMRTRSPFTEHRYGIEMFQRMKNLLLHMAPRENEDMIK